MSGLVVFGLSHHGDEDVLVEGCHAAVMSAPTDGYAPRRVDKRAKLPMTGQCLSLGTQPGFEMAGRSLLEACPSCWMVGACDC